MDANAILLAIGTAAVPMIVAGWAWAKAHSAGKWYADDVAFIQSVIDASATKPAAK